MGVATGYNVGMVATRHLRRIGTPHRAHDLRPENPRREIFYLGSGCVERRAAKERNCIKLRHPCMTNRGRLECFSEDPIGFEAGDSNLYRYVGNGPTNATDPTGLEEQMTMEQFRRIKDPEGIMTSYLLEMGYREEVLGQKAFIINPFDKHFFLWATGRTMVYDAWAMSSCGISHGYQEARKEFDETAANADNRFVQIVANSGKYATYPMEVTSHLSMRTGQYGVARTIGGLPGVSNVLSQNESVLRIGGVILVGKHTGETAIRTVSAHGDNRPSVGDYLDVAVGVWAVGAEYSPVSTVSRWGQPGLHCGQWVQKGGPNWLNWRLSGKWQRGGTNRYAPFESRETFAVPSSQLAWPRNGIIDGPWKGLFGQRIYVGPNTVAPNTNSGN